MALNFKPFQMLTSVRLTIHVRMAPLVLTMLADISVCVPQDIKENNVIKVQAAFLTSYLIYAAFFNHWHYIVIIPEEINDFLSNF